MLCSYCYGNGHNKMGCKRAPKAMEKAATVLPQWEEWQQMDHETLITEAAFGEPSGILIGHTRNMKLWRYGNKSKSAVEKTKKCNFCGDTGHNKRTCPKLKHTRLALHKAELGFRASVVAALKRQVKASEP